MNAHFDTLPPGRRPGRLVSLLLCLGLLMGAGRTHAQRGEPVYRSLAESGFQKALDRYQKGDLARARDEFQGLMDMTPAHPRSSASALMLAKTLYRLKEYASARAAVATLYETYPESRYLPDGDLVVGDCRFREGDAVGAAEHYVRILRGEADVRLKARAADRLAQLLATRRLTAAQSDRLKRDLPGTGFDEAAQFGGARWAFRAGRTESAAGLGAAFLKAYPESPYAGEMRAMLRTIPEPAAPPATASSSASFPRAALVEIGVICPLSRELGRELKDGISLAREMMPPATVDSLRVRFEDSNDDPVTSVKLVQKFVSDRDVVAILGDLTSRATVPAAAVANALQVPLITPTASEDGIAGIGPYVFQMNATPGAQGRQIAERAYRAGLRTFAILAALDSYGKHMAESFTLRVEALGGRVIASEWYTPGTTDFQGQLQRIREAGAALSGVPPARAAADTNGAAADSTQAPPSFDGLLVAAQSPEDVIMTVTQISTSPIAAHLLGGDGWNSPSVSREIGAVAQQALFVSKYYEDPADLTARRFREAFRARYGRAPNVASSLGFDAMTCLLKAVAAGGLTRESLRERLSAGQEFAGATGRVILAPGERENSGMYLLTIRDGRIVPAEP